MYYFEYNGLKFVVAYETIDADELCIYPNVWKIENKSAFPSVIHYETSSINEFDSKYYNKMLSIEEEINKIIIIKKVKIIILQVFFIFFSTYHIIV